VIPEHWYSGTGKEQTVLLELGSNKLDEGKATILKHILKAKEGRRMFQKLGYLRTEAEGQRFV
jgi:hypothetical protein